MPIGVASVNNGSNLYNLNNFVGYFLYFILQIGGVYVILFMILCEKQSETDAKRNN